jgi:rare lipoprotein A (peptidoglycan hydrolase)
VRGSGVFVLALLAMTACVARAARGAPARVELLPRSGPAPAGRPACAEQPVTGVATFYGAAFNGQPMADGRPFDMRDPTITASNHWPLGTRLRVRRAPGSPWSGILTSEERAGYLSRSIVVTVADRGNFDHALDLSAAAFALLGSPDEGVIRVTIEPLGATAADCGAAQ